jgi:hypothetical protein
MKRQYTMMLTVDEEALGETITAVTPLIGAQRVVLGTIAIIQTEEPRRKRDTRGDAPVSETRLGKVVLELLSTGQCSVEEISTELRAKGFAATSVSPVTSKLVAEGLVERFTTSLNGRTARCYRLSRPQAAPIA